MPSMTALGTLTFDLPRAANVFGIRRQGIERDPCHVCIAFGVSFKKRGGVADRGVRHAHAPVEPRPAAQAADDRDANRLRHRFAGHGARVPEVEERGACILEALGLDEELFNRDVAAVEFGKYSNPLAYEGLDGRFIAEF